MQCHEQIPRMAVRRVRPHRLCVYASIDNNVAKHFVGIKGGGFGERIDRTERGGFRERTDAACARNVRRTRVAQTAAIAQGRTALGW
jgi:hypothetical protein